MAQITESTVAIVIVATWFLQNHPFYFATDIIITLGKIQEMLYSPETKRSINDKKKIFWFLLPFLNKTLTRTK